MSEVVVRVEGLSKQYRIGARQERHDTLRDEIVSNLKSLFGLNGHASAVRKSNGNPASESLHKEADTIWALKDVSFEVKQGEVLGIIGRNGAGKSTLLKILSRITPPTGGRIEIDGRVASLLEVGTGFHPELTGRENIYLNGTILGMKKAEIDHKFDEIVAFAEIDQFLDTPVKRYSSGMYVRLAFAVAAHLEPEILIVDEVLAVGDASFQKKSLGKIGEVTKSGRTVLLVSHNMHAILNFSHKALLIEGGRVTHKGEVAGVVDRYLSTTNEDGNTFLPALADHSGDLRARIEHFEVSPNPPRTGAPIEFTFHVSRETSSRGTLSAELAVAVSSEQRARLFQLSSHHMGIVFEIPQGESTISVRLDQLPLAPGRYFVYLWLGTGNMPVHFIRNSFVLVVEPGQFANGYFVDNRGFPVVVPSEWQSESRGQPLQNHQAR